ncbi:hypothetical protein VPNG_08820 [Cytospora leucostoma]|uniref:Uncharacterized protein n=1 Tax=Cytospora leucostoma TaxID=1230097 RepID=A0A423W1K2_9PEZI|nr:hypothetical protein VPNG_08820 [Cytospora leucostoma]
MDRHMDTWNDGNAEGQMRGILRQSTQFKQQSSSREVEARGGRANKSRALEYALANRETAWGGLDGLDGPDGGYHWLLVVAGDCWATAPVHGHA